MPPSSGTIRDELRTPASSCRAIIYRPLKNSRGVSADFISTVAD
jgi:hypothetical protein